MMAKRFSALVLAFLFAALAASAPAQTPKPMKLTLNFLAGGPQAGFMYAKKLGYYKDAGIDLTIEEGKGSATTAQQVATNQTDVAFADAPAAMQIRQSWQIIANLFRRTRRAGILRGSSNIERRSCRIHQRIESAEADVLR